ncbi:MAG: UDP-glucose 6-dehydrogenase [Rhodobiaceae bacterium]|nr:UDP-glucose 6-dehydrogenase [Rhodobiaceae bacterium]|tara:strand:+ start:1879 stop:3201 length:1323 start_codon:yes stop_codon:yes gene_type:complete
MKISIIGSGYVGLVTGACLARADQSVTCLDINEKKIEDLKNGIIPIYEPGLEDLIEEKVKNSVLSFSSNIAETIKKADVIFIAVGTPTNIENDSADLSQVFACAEAIGKNIKNNTVVILKSTVPVGTCDKIEEIISLVNPAINFDVVSNPEFLREGSAIFDFENPDRIIVGTKNQNSISTLNSIYKKQADDHFPIIFTTRRSSELIKYASNSMLAMRIIFINEIADLCEKVGADVEDIAIGIGLDKRIGPKFLNAGPGFGGSCFPKDARALVETGENYNAPQNLLKAVIDGNEKRKKNLSKKITSITKDKKNIGVLGVTYKANTDDMREAPSISIISDLINKGFNISIYDPQAKKVGIKEFKKANWENDIYSVAKNSDCLVILTEWTEFKNMDLKKISDIMNKPIIIDFRNLFSIDEMEKLKIEYHSVGREAVNFNKETK